MCLLERKYSGYWVFGLYSKGKVHTVQYNAVYTIHVYLLCIICHISENF